jgi:hypothetical protein
MASAGTGGRNFSISAESSADWPLASLWKGFGRPASQSLTPP